jgi:ubiquinone/menaquinone biosynthesis C-methylase UbiE
MTINPTYAEFSDPRLVALYDTANALGDDSDFFCHIAQKLSSTSIIDLGCGTGLLTCELAKCGHKMIGVEPSEEMLKVAQRKNCSEQVQWIKGGYEKLEGLQTEMVLMTSHVAQFFIDDEEWQKMLKATHKTLKPGGHIVFDSRNPLTKPWEKWTRETSSKKFNTPNGEIEMWYQLLELKNNCVLYEIHYLFIKTNEKLVSVNKLIYRSQAEITQSIVDGGFIVQNIYGDWESSPFGEKSPEMIFVAVRNE